MENFSHFVELFTPICQRKIAATMAPNKQEMALQVEQKILEDAAIQEAKVIELFDTGSEPLLAVVISLTNANGLQQPDTHAIIKRARKSLRRKAKDTNSALLIPKRWIVLDSLPTASGAVDEDALRRQLDLSFTSGDTEMSAEERIRRTISTVLRLPLEDVQPSKSFIRLGGDSITAIEVMSNCLSHNIVLKVADILSSPDLATLASLANAAGTSTTRTNVHVNGVGDVNGKASNTSVANPAHSVLSYWGLSSGSLDNAELGTDQFRVPIRNAHILDDFSSQTEVLAVCIAAVVKSFRDTFVDYPRISCLATTSDPKWCKALGLHMQPSGSLAQTIRYLKESLDTAQMVSAKSFAAEDIAELYVRYDDGSVQGGQSNGIRKARSMKTWERPSLFSIEISRDGPDLVLELNRPRGLERSHDIVNWMEGCQKSLERGIELANDPTTFYTISSFPLLSLSHSELDHLVSSCQSLGYNAIDGAYPCSAVQEGILLSQIRSKDAYTIECNFVARTRSDSETTILERMEAAWRRVVAHHSALRTVFLSSVREKSAFDQIVLAHVEPEINRLASCKDEKTAMEALRSLEGVFFPPHRPAHQLTMCTTDNGRVFCKLQISHAIVDGMSLAVLFRDLQLAYAGSLREEHTSDFGSYISFLQDTQSEETGREALEHWQRYLADVKPSYFPTISDESTEPVFKSMSIEIDTTRLQSFCKTQGATLATVVQSIWGIILQGYTLTDDVCFGYLTSGRDVPVSGLQTMVGTLIHLLVCRIKCDGSETFSDLLQRLQRQLGPALQHQYTSLAKIQHSLSLEQRLFNTVVSVIYPPALRLDKEPDLELEHLANRAATEVCDVFNRFEAFANNFTVRCGTHCRFDRQVTIHLHRLLHVSHVRARRAEACEVFRKSPGHCIRFSHYSYRRHKNHWRCRHRPSLL